MINVISFPIEVKNYQQARFNPAQRNEVKTASHKSSALKAPVSFYGHKIKKWGREDRYFGEYKNSLSNKSPLKVMDILNATDMTPEQNMNFLTKVTSDSETSKKFIDEIIRDEDGNFEPKKSGEVVKTLVEELGGKDNFEDWYMKKGGYAEAFQVYGEEFYESTDDINELCAFLPNWGSWALRDKFASNYQKNFGCIYSFQQNGATVVKDNFTLGELPPEFESKEDYRNFIYFLSEHMEDIFQGKELSAKGKFKSIKSVSAGDSGKCNLLLDDKYVLKFDPYRGNEVGAIVYNEYRDCSPDSNYTNALVDYYTNLYSENSSVKMHFYDNHTSSTLYEYAKGENPTFESDEIDANSLTRDFKETFSDLFKTGIRYTDFYNKNYIRTEDGVKCIDSGHANYFDILKPGIQSKTLSLQSKTGFSPLEFHGALAEVLG